MGYRLTKRGERLLAAVSWISIVATVILGVMLTLAYFGLLER